MCVNKAHTFLFLSSSFFYDVDSEVKINGNIEHANLSNLVRFFHTHQVNQVFFICLIHILLHFVLCVYCVYENYFTGVRHYNITCSSINAMIFVFNAF